MSPYIVPGLKEKAVRYPGHTPISDLVAAFCSITGRRLEWILEKDRHKERVKYRHALVYFIRKLTDATHRQICEVVTGYDHTVSIHAIKSVQDRIDTDEDYREWLNAIHPYSQKVKTTSEAEAELIARWEGKRKSAV